MVGEGRGFGQGSRAATPEMEEEEEEGGEGGLGGRVRAGPQACRPEPRGSLSPSWSCLYLTLVWGGAHFAEPLLAVSLGCQLVTGSRASFLPVSCVRKAVPVLSPRRVSLGSVRAQRPVLPRAVSPRPCQPLRGRSSLSFSSRELGPYRTKLESRLLGEVDDRGAFVRPRVLSQRSRGFWAPLQILSVARAWEEHVLGLWL